MLRDRFEDSNPNRTVQLSRFKACLETPNNDSVRPNNEKTCSVRPNTEQQRNTGSDMIDLDWIGSIIIRHMIDRFRLFVGRISSIVYVIP